VLLATRSAAVALCFFGRVRLWLSVMSLARRVGFVMLNTATMPCFTVLADLVHNDFHGLPLDPVPLSVADGEASDRLAVDKKSPPALPSGSCMFSVPCCFPNVLRHCGSELLSPSTK